MQATTATFFTGARGSEPLSNREAYALLLATSSSMTLMTFLPEGRVVETVVTRPGFEPESRVLALELTSAAIVRDRGVR
jgi:hypothetical protein